MTDQIKIVAHQELTGNNLADMILNVIQSDQDYNRVIDLLKSLGWTPPIEPDDESEDYGNNGDSRPTESGDWQTDITYGAGFNTLSEIERQHYRIVGTEYVENGE